MSLPGLNYRISADVSKFESAMTRAKDMAVKNTVEIATRFTQATAAAQGMSAAAGKIPGVLRNVATAFIVFATAKASIDLITAATRGAAEQVERLAVIGRDAARLNVSTDFLQSMTASTRNLGMEADQVVKTLERLRDVSIVRQGSGGEDARNESAMEARLRRQAELGNIRASDVVAFAVAPDTEAKFKMLLELMQRLMAEGRALAALDIGSKFLDATTLDRIRQNRAELDRIVEAAREIKPAEIFRREDIERSQDLSRRLAEAKNTLDKGLRPIYDDLALAAYSFHQGNVEWVEFLARQIPRLVGLYQQLKGAIQSATPGQDGLTPGQRAGQQMGTLIGTLASGRPVTASASDTDPAMAAAREKLARTMNPYSIARQQREAQAISDAVHPDRTKPDAHRKTAPPSPSESLDQIESYINAVQRTGEVLQAEYDALGKSNAEREKGIALARLAAAARSAGREATDQERERVLALAEANAKLTDSLADQRQKLAENAEAMRTFGRMGEEALADMIFEGKSLNDVIANMSKQLGKMALQALVTGQGPLAGLVGMSAPASGGQNAIGGILALLRGLGGTSSGPAPSGAAGGGGLASLFQIFMKLFGGGFASGGKISGPGTGTSDSIPIWASNGEYMVNAAATREYLPLLQAINARKLAKGGFIGATPRIGSVPAIPLARPAGAAGGLNVIVNEAPGVKSTVSRKGNTVTVDQVMRRMEDGMARRAADGKSSLADVFGGGSNPAFLNG